MKQIHHAALDFLLEIIEWVERVIAAIKRNPKPRPTLIAHNIDWFTHCNWIEKSVAFKHINN